MASTSSSLLEIYLQLELMLEDEHLVKYSYSVTCVGCVILIMNSLYVNFISKKYARYVSFAIVLFALHLLSFTKTAYFAETETSDYPFGFSSMLPKQNMC